MATGTVEVADVVVPEIFSPYFQQITAEKSRLVQAGVISVDAAIAALLSSGGLTFNTPSWQDLDNDDDNVSSDTGSDSATKKLASFLVLNM